MSPEETEEVAVLWAGKISRSLWRRTEEVQSQTEVHLGAG